MITWILEKVLGVIVGWFPEQYKTIVELVFLLLLALAVLASGVYAGVWWKQKDVDAATAQLTIVKQEKQNVELKYAILQQDIDKAVADAALKQEAARQAMIVANAMTTKLNSVTDQAKRRVDGASGVGVTGQYSASAVLDENACERAVIQDKETR